MSRSTKPPEEPVVVPDEEEELVETPPKDDPTVIPDTQPEGVIPAEVEQPEHSAPIWEGQSDVAQAPPPANDTQEEPAKE